ERVEARVHGRDVRAAHGALVADPVVGILGQELRGRLVGLGEVAESTAEDQPRAGDERRTPTRLTPAVEGLAQRDRAVDRPEVAEGEPGSGGWSGVIRQSEVLR